MSCGKGKWMCVGCRKQDGLVSVECDEWEQCKSSVLKTADEACG